MLSGLQGIKAIAMAFAETLGKAIFDYLEFTKSSLQHSCRANMQRNCDKIAGYCSKSRVQRCCTYWEVSLAKRVYKEA